MLFKSCHWILHGLNFEFGHLEICCLRCHKGGGNIVIKNPYNGEVLDWDEVYELKKPYIEENQRGIINPKCEGCFNLYDNEWHEETERFISYLHFSHWTHCNCNCIYCYTDVDKQFYNNSSHYSVLPAVKDLFEKKLFRKGGEITFAGGEPTILDEFEELIDLLVDNDCEKITVHTSGIKFSPALARGIKKGVIEVVVSMDAGYEETFKVIKGINAYKKVVENLKLYVEAENPENKPLVANKYIMLPEINDSIEEVEKWISVTTEAGARAIVVDIEHEWYKRQREKAAFPQYARDILSYIHKRGEELGLEIILYNSARYFMANEHEFPNYDFVPYKYKALMTEEELQQMQEEEQKKSKQVNVFQCDIIKKIQSKYTELLNNIKCKCSNILNILKK